jgi:hypothetical protein
LLSLRILKELPNNIARLAKPCRSESLRGHQQNCAIDTIEFRKQWPLLGSTAESAAEINVSNYSEFQLYVRYVAGY